MPYRLLAGVVALLSLTLLSPSPTPTAAAEAAAAGAAAESRPNVVVIMVDDMREDEMRWMPHTRRLISQFELTDFISNHPLCCPARAEFLTGQFGHHNGVHHNPGAHGGYRQMVDPDNTVATWFDRAGYRTSLVGKFMNGWAPRLGKPGGWDKFSPLTRGVYKAYGFSAWHDGKTRDYEDIHSNDFVTETSVARLNGAAKRATPFFHFASYTSPHNYVAHGSWQRGPIPAVRHQGLFRSATPPSSAKPSFDPKPGMRVVHTFRQRIRALQSVDEGVRAIVRATKTNGTYDDTVFVFTSDNGYMLGEHRLFGKNVPYEEALQVPLLASGPGIPTGKSGKGAMITDLAPSLSALAGVKPARPQDGRSDLFSVEGGWSQTLIQADDNNPETAWWWRGVREGGQWVYVRYTNRPPQLFDLQNDPYQLENLSGELPEVEERLRTSIPEVENHRRLRQTQDRALQPRSLPNG